MLPLRCLAAAISVADARRATPGRILSHRCDRGVALMPGDWPRAPFDRIPGYYRELVDKYGHDSRACDYGDAGSQRIKFALLAQAVGADCRSVLDVGCGFGDYLAYLVRRNFGGEYVGIDISDAMVERARKLHPHSEILHGNFLFAEFSRSFDVVTANGIFY